MLKEKQINIRLTELQYTKLEEQMKKYNYTSISEYLRFVGLNAVIETKIKE